MVIRMSRMLPMIVLAACIIALAAAAFCFFGARSADGPSIMAGGYLHDAPRPSEDAQKAYKSKDPVIGERFQRPSKQPAVNDKYTFQNFEKHNAVPPLGQKCFQTPEDLILGYYGILKNAANMQGFSGGCGTIGDAMEPYPYAYELLTQETRSKMSLRQYVDSFRGIGHISLLTFTPAHIPPGTPDNIRYYMVEIEIITGKPVDKGEESGGYVGQISYFAYYYGIVTVEQTAEKCWLIRQLDFLPEEFLCAPQHGWFYDSNLVVEFVYKQGLKLVDSVDKIVQKNNQVSIYASGGGKQYRFDFLRLTNGHDVLLHENILMDGVWKETDLSKGVWQKIKFSVESPDLH